MKSILVGLITAIVLALLLSSCSLQKRCAALYPPHIDTSFQKSDSVLIKEVIKFHDVPVYVLGDSVLIHDTVPCGTNYHGHAKSELVQADVIFADGILSVACKTDSLLQVVAHLSDTLREVRQKSSDVKTIDRIVQIPVEVPKPYIPKIFWYSLVLNAGLLIWTFRNPLRKLFSSLLPKILKLFA